MRGRENVLSVVGDAVAPPVAAALGRCVALASGNQVP